eukprot:scaffold178044_cov21-Tisochrysis_lutea.AAC.1
MTPHAQLSPLAALNYRPSMHKLKITDNWYGPKACASAGYYCFFLNKLSSGPRWQRGITFGCFGGFLRYMHMNRERRKGKGCAVHSVTDSCFIDSCL